MMLITPPCPYYSLINHDFMSIACQRRHKVERPAFYPQYKYIYPKQFFADLDQVEGVQLVQLSLDVSHRRAVFRTKAPAPLQELPETWAHFGRLGE